MSEAFDIGPLSWVKDEIDQSLKKVMDNFIVVTEHPEDYASLRFTMAHLYQVSGALDMVGLEGCKRYCTEIEKLTSKIEKGLMPVSAALMEDLMLAVQTLSQYLQDLLNGAPDTPIRFFDSLKHLASLQGETFEITDLFYPDTSFGPPKELLTNPISDGALPIFIGEQRVIFQKSLLDWLMTKDANALERMKNALFNVQTVQQKKSQKSLWWAATAFAEALSQEKVAALAGAKKLCRKLDQQLRNMSLGEAKVPSHLLRDVLYYVAISDRSSEQISKVKDVFELDAVLPSQTEAANPILMMSEAEAAAIAQLLAELPHLKELWVGVSEFVTDQDIAKQTPREELQSVTLKLQLLLENMQNQGVNQKNVNNQHLMQLMDATQQVSQQLLDEVEKLNENAVLEVASALNLLEILANTYETLELAIENKVTQQIARLKEIVENKAINSATTHPQSIIEPELDDQLIEAVANQIIQTLRSIEKSIDGFFRNPSITTGLDDALKPMSQVVAAFDMLEMPTPKTIAKLSIFYIEQFKANAPEYATPHPNHSQFNLFAEALSLLGLYAQDLPEVRAESKHALSDCLKRLEEGVQTLESTEEEIKETSVAEVQADPAETPVEEFVEIARFSDAEVTEKAIDAELQEIFITEAQEILENNTLNIQALQNNETNPLALTELRRAFHTLKGSGRTVGLEAMGDVAHGVEKLLNVLLEHKTHPTEEILTFVDTINTEFATWVAQLIAEQQATLTPGKYQQQAAEMTEALENRIQSAKPKARKEEVLIGGSRKVGRAFFYLFLGEAQGHLNTLKDAQKAIKENSTAQPTPSSCRAAHTLSSNALTAGFDAIGDLARALEHWFDAFTGVWSDKQLGLYAKVIQALEEGLEKAKNLQNPKSTRSLMIELSKSTASMQVLAAQLAENSKKALSTSTKATPDFPLSEHEAFGTELSASELTIASNLISETIEDDVETLETITELPPAKILQAPHILLKTPPQESVQSKPVFALQPVSLAMPERLALQGEASASSQNQLSNLTESHENAPLQSIATPVDQELLGLFIEEAGDLVPLVSRSLRNWKFSPHVEDYAEEVQRALHTLKGSARTAGQLVIGDSVHALEDRVANVLERKPTLDDFDHMFIDFDRISFMLDDLIKSQSAEQEALQPQISQVSLEQQIEESLAAPIEEIPTLKVEAPTDLTLPEQPASAAPTELTSQFLRVRASMLDKLINDAGEVTILRSRMDREMQGFKQSAADLTMSVGRLRTYLQELEVEAESQLQSRLSSSPESNTPETDKNFDPLEMDRYTRLQELTRLMAESLSDVTTIQQNLLTHIDQTDVALQQQNRMNRELQKGLMTVRMMPFSSISERLHRIVRQVSRELDKRVELMIDGEDIELDRSVLDKVGAPLEHLLRNAVAHGLETTEERTRLGKPETGKIALKVRVENDEISLTVSDDGSGIDLQKVKKIAIEKGLLKENQPINDQSLMAIIFESGFSTEESISQVAGRGVGLDAVRSDIAALNGRIDVSNAQDAGAVFNIYLPVTLSVTQVVMVKINQQQFAIPSVMVEQIQTLKQEALLQAYETQKVQWGSGQGALQDYNLYHLAKLLGNSLYQPKSQAYNPVALLRSGQYRTAVHLDEVIGNQEIVMKSMGTQLARVPGIVGATVMGDGAIVFVINPVQLAHREAFTAGAVRMMPIVSAVPVKKSALVVDDSLTMRKVLARILERDGFEVMTANDGLDAIQKLQDLTPDIILTDIEMPRMDGFEFSRYIRDTEQYKHIPIIMISSRTAQKHRMIANEIGVNAFLGKPVQDEELMAEVHNSLNLNKNLQ